MCVCACACVCVWCRFARPLPDDEQKKMIDKVRRREGARSKLDGSVIFVADV